MCHLQKVDDTLVDGCGNWEHLHSFREVKCLQGCSKTLWMGIKMLWLFSVPAEDSIMVVTICNQSGGRQFDSRQWAILNSRFIIFMFSSSGGMKFLILVEDSDSVYCFAYNPGLRGCGRGGGLWGRRSPRFPCVTPVVESFFSDLLRAMMSYWAGSHLEFCQTSCRRYKMELFCENYQRS